MSKSIGVSFNVLHDFYYNTWSKKFCADFSLHKDIIQDMLNREFKQGNYEKKYLISKAMNILHNRFPDLFFHYQTVYQFINYRVKYYQSHLMTSPSESPSPRKAESEQEDNTQLSDVDMKELAVLL